jgi:hypothetical protein
LGAALDLPLQLLDAPGEPVAFAVGAQGLLRGPLLRPEPVQVPGVQERLAQRVDQRVHQQRLIDGVLVAVVLAERPVAPAAVAPPPLGGVADQK